LLLVVLRVLEILNLLLDLKTNRRSFWKVREILKDLLLLDMGGCGCDCSDERQRSGK